MPDRPHLIIGTRGSDLALWQAHHVRDLITAAGGTVEIKVLSTQGDREQVQAFEKLEGKGFFTKEIEEALLSGAIDIAVHSHKDLETRQPAGLSIAAVPSRASQRDVLLIRASEHAVAPWLPLRHGAKVGTSSVRRRDQLLLLRPDLNIAALRGNVPTRIEKLRSGPYDAIVLAEAGIDRLELDLGDLNRHALDPKHFVPAPAQGALALQMREGDARAAFIAGLGDADAGPQVEEERSVLRALEGGCQLPFGSHWDREAGKLRCFLQTSTGPKRAYAKTAAQALERLQVPPSKTLTVLITRMPRREGPLRRLGPAHGLHIEEHPSVIPTPLDSPSIPADAAHAQWAWIGSPGAARTAESWLISHPAVRIATPGHGTAESLATALHSKLAFIGNGSPTEAWRAFASARRQNEIIAVPHSTQSLSRWTSHPSAASLCTWAHYAPEKNSSSPPKADVVCFTSPSSVQAWTAPRPERIIAIGPTTAAALNERNWKHSTAQSHDDFGILEAILSDEASPDAPARNPF